MAARCAALLVGLLVSVPVTAQTVSPPADDESGFKAELRREGERLRDKCGTFSLKAIGSCGIALATDHPIHMAVGTLAPQNGIGFGPALVMHATPNENWRVNWNADVVGAAGGAWRAGGYLKIVRTAVGLPVVTRGTSDEDMGGIHVYPVIDVYAQTISLPKLSYFGLGPESTRNDKSFFGMRQTLFGTGARIPIRAGGFAPRLNLSLLADVTARSVDIRPSVTNEAPSIEQRYTEATAPGLADQPFVVQFGEGVRLNPSVANGRLRLNYVSRFHQYVAADSSYSFRRWTLDLDHEIPLSRTSGPRSDSETNGPDDCSLGPSTRTCASASRNRTGTVNVRMLVSRSGVSNGAAVPFYFQQTLGGSDINGNRGLASYEDYRFRGPNLILFRESVEHSIGTWPVGIWLAADQGRVSLQDAGDPGAFRRSFTVGLSLRAGGFPAVLASWSKGGPEGAHFSFTINASVLGGSARPSLD